MVRSGWRVRRLRGIRKDQNSVMRPEAFGFLKKKSHFPGCLKILYSDFSLP